MGVAERKAKEKEELKSLILNAAKKLFVEKGVEGTTIRNIADEIDYSVGTLYIYYKDKNEILYEINNLGFQQLREQMFQSVSTEHPLKKLKLMFSTYIDFALNNKELYDLMFIMDAPILFLEGNNHKEWCKEKGVYGMLREVIGECVELGYFKDQPIDSLALNIWGIAHGLSSLYIRKRLTAINCPENAVSDAVNEFLKMIHK